MSLVVADRIGDVPFLLGDVIVSQQDKPKQSITVPTISDISRIIGLSINRSIERLRQSRWQQECGQISGFVFRCIHDEFHSRKSVYNRFREGLERAGIDWERRHISLRSLRTTYNTRMRQMLLANAMSEDLLRFFIGHRSVQMTDRYDNPELEAKLRSMQSITAQVNKYWN